MCLASGDTVIATLRAGAGREGRCGGRREISNHAGVWSWARFGTAHVLAEKFGRQLPAEQTNSL